MMYEEFEKEGVLYIRETYENGLITEYIKPSEAGTPKETAPTVPEEKAGVTNEMLEKEMKEIKAMVMEIGMASVKPPSELPELPPKLPELNSLPPLPEGMTIDTDLLKSMMGGS